MARPPAREGTRAPVEAFANAPVRRRAVARALLAACGLGVALGTIVLGTAIGTAPALAAEPPPDGALLVVDGLIDPPAALADGAGAALVDLALLDAVGAGGYRVRALGIDDYAAELDPDEIERYPVIVAWRHDGAPMTVRTLGPLRIVYPFDEHPELANASGESRSVWQLVRLTVLD